MTGTEGQIAWAELIKPRVNAEFDRVSRAFRATASFQQEEDRIDTDALIAILEEKRAEVMANDRAGYFIRHWIELTDQVRQMISQDPRFAGINTKRRARRGKHAALNGLVLEEHEQKRSE